MEQLEKNEWESFSDNPKVRVTLTKAEWSAIVISLQSSAFESENQGFDHYSKEQFKLMRKLNSLSGAFENNDTRPVCVCCKKPIKTEIRASTTQGNGGPLHLKCCSKGVD
jgi:hypothetical protein